MDCGSDGNGEETTANGVTNFKIDNGRDTYRADTAYSSGSTYRDYNQLPRDSSSSERELDTTELNDKVRDKKFRLSKEPMSAPRNVATESTPMEFTENARPSCAFTFDMNNTATDMNVSSQPSVIESLSAEVKNEYDYVKLSRVRGSNGMGAVVADVVPQNESRTCDSNDVTTILEQSSHVALTNGNIATTSQNCSSNSTALVNTLSVAVNQVSLSPELTDCDSNEVESVLSDDGKSTLMPTVEDGLSSGQASDVDDSQQVSTPPPANQLLDNKVRDFFNRGDSSVEDSPVKQQALLERKKALDKAIQVQIKKLLRLS